MDFQSLSFANAPSMKTSIPGPRSKELLEFQSIHEGAAISYPRGLPVALDRARGATVQDVDGNVFLDFFGGAGVMNVGHSNPAVLKAVEGQLSRLTHALDLPNEYRESLVVQLVSLLPSKLDKLFFGGPTGSDAVEASMKLARYNTSRHPMISFEGAYHGMSAGALSLSSGRAFKEPFLPLVPEIHFVPYAYCYRCAFGREAHSCEMECVKYIEHIIDDPHSGVGLPAAIIVEAVQGEGGSIPPPPAFLQGIRDICDKYKILMIVDEIQAGLCRTGKMFAFQHSGIIPDILTLSKGLGGLGFPISCIAYKKELDSWPPGQHIGTFRGNVTAYAAGTEALRFMKDNHLDEYSLRLGEKMLSWLKTLEKDSKIVGDVRGAGLMLGIEMVTDRDTKQPGEELAQKVRTACLQRGLLIEIGGHYSNVVRFLPPLILTEDLAQRGVDIFIDAVQSVAKTC
ncbi:aspartate aminotransferase family protein [Acidobacteriota bacterium]